MMTARTASIRRITDAVRNHFTQQRLEAIISQEVLSVAKENQQKFLIEINHAIKAVRSETGFPAPPLSER